MIAWRHVRVWLVRFALVTCVVGLSSGLHAEVGDPATIELFIGEVSSHAIQSDNVFVADDSIVKLDVLGPDQIKLKGLKVGESQLLYWQGGKLHYVPIFVTNLQSLDILSSDLRLNHDLPYHQYSVSHSSGFSEETFFKNPFYAHSLFSHFPFDRSDLNYNLSLSHSGAQDFKFTNAFLDYQRRNIYFGLGKTGVGLGRLSGAPSSGTNFFGGYLQLHNPLNLYKRIYTSKMTFFGGLDQTADLLKPDTTRKQFGLNYFIEKYDKRLRPTFLNINAHGFNIIDESKFTIGANIEGNYYLFDDLSLSVGGYLGDNKMAAAISPSYEIGNNSISANYRFINHNFPEISGARTVNDRHSYALNGQAFLSETSFIAAGLSHDISLAKTADATTSQTLGGNLRFSRHPTPESGYTVKYQVLHASSSSVESLSNTVSADYSRRLNLRSYYSLNGNYSQTDLAGKNKQFSMGGSWNYQDTKLLHSVGLNNSVEIQPSTAAGSTLQYNLQRVFRSGEFDFAAAYSKRNVTDDTHQLTANASLVYYMTPIHQLNLSVNNSLHISSEASLTGRLSIVYLQYFGKGVQKESLFRALFLGGQKAPVEGTLFLDHNYDGFFSEGDRLLENVVVIIDGKKKVVSNGEGHYKFSPVKLGKHSLSIDETTIPFQVESVNRSFYVTSSQRKIVSIPLQIPKASIRVKVMLDANDNRVLDDSDVLYSYPEISLRDASGLIRKAKASTGALFKGVDHGEITVYLDPALIPQDLDVIGVSEKKILVDDIQEYEVVFFVSAYRSLRGRIIVISSDGKRPNLRRLKVQVGDHETSVDAQGYYLFEHLSAGEHSIAIENLPKGYCVVSSKQKIQVPFYPMLQNRQIKISSRCEANETVEIPIQ
jgi:hypothetical protein